MSGYEFVPKKYMDPNSQQQYWSQNGNVQGYNSTDNSMGMEQQQYMAKSTLATSASAAEFVPGRGSGQPSVNGMNSGAAVFNPNLPRGRSESSGQSAYHDGDMGLSSGMQSQSMAEGMIESTVEVTWNGSTFFVPESTAYAYDGSIEFPPVPEENVGLEWTQGSLSLPAPPRRTIQTIGIPEPVRQHFQSLDVEALRQMPPDDERYKGGGEGNRRLCYFSCSRRSSSGRLTTDLFTLHTDLLTYRCQHALIHLTHLPLSTHTHSLNLLTPLTLLTYSPTAVTPTHLLHPPRIRNHAVRAPLVAPIYHIHPRGHVALAPGREVVLHLVNGLGGDHLVTVGDRLEEL